MEYVDTRIKSVAEYLMWVEETYSVDAKDDSGEVLSFRHNETYFRGHSCECWELKPSILRLQLDEHRILRKASLRLWNETSHLRSYLEKMIFFQHFGLCTRLLDITFNPLVALYMACYEEDKYSSNGAIYSGYHGDEQNLKIAELTAKYVFEHEVQEIIFGLDRFAQQENVNIHNFQAPVFIYPPMNNPRIEAQNGAFIMAPLVENSFDNNTAKLNKESLEGTGFFDERRAIVEGCHKASILHELAVLGVDSGTIYKGVEAKMKAIVTEEKWKSNLFNNINL